MNGLQIYLQTLKSRPQADEATRLYAVACGGSGGDEGFTADAYFTGGSMFSWGTAHDVSGLSNPMPAAYYNSFRFSETNFIYFFNVTNGDYLIRLHFSSGADGSFNEGGQMFDVRVNGVTRLLDYSPYAAAGNSFNRGVIEEISATVSGGLELNFVNKNQIRSLVSGIEIYQL